MSQGKLFRLRNMTKGDITHLLTVLAAILLLCAFPLAYILMSEAGEKPGALLREGHEINLTAVVTNNPPSTIGLLSVADTKMQQYYRISIREDGDRSTFLPILGKEVYNHTLTAEPLELTWTLNPCVETWIDVSTNDGYFTKSFKPTAVCG